MRTILLLVTAGSMLVPAQQIVTIRPKQIHDVLINPGIGLIAGRPWTGTSRDGPRLPEDPQSRASLAFLIVYWRALEPEQGQYRWELIDAPLARAHEHGQTVMMRIEPYGAPNGQDVPSWYRAMVGSEPNKRPIKKWLTDPEDPRYALRFGNAIRAVGARYDGHPDLESVDLAIVGSWGEGEGSALLTQKTREALVDSYVEAFRKTPLIALMMDAKTNRYALSKTNAGWRADCLGDMGGFSPTFSHMQDYYPQGIANFGLTGAWEKAPVTFESCWVVGTWHQKGWDLDYIIDQSLKWHISSFNAKSSPIPREWWPKVDRWLKSMGYRFVLRKFTYPAAVRPSGRLAFATWWENQGVAPCYGRFPLALRLNNADRATVLMTGADIRTWLPGDAVYDDVVYVPADTSPGEYEIEIAMLDPRTRAPAIKLAIEGRQPDGWYRLGKMRVE